MNTELPLIFMIEGVFHIPKKGTVVCGKMQTKVDWPDVVEVRGENFALVGKCGGIECFRKEDEEIQVGDDLGVLIMGGATHPEVKEGMSLYLKEHIPRPPQPTPTKWEKFKSWIRA